MVVFVIIFTDKKGFFTADQTNNHIRKKWASFYDFTKNKEVDVIILGNSHIITGVDPFVLSNATSSTCFILGNSGTGIIDAWFQLGEALKQTQPKLVILETFCINDQVKHEGEDIPYLQSFDAQKNVFYKLKSMPQLFHSDSWVEAWSPTIRNHSFIFTDTARIKHNLQRPRDRKSPKLDLGRFARFGIGLQDSTLQKYEESGAHVNGKEYQISDFSRKYLRKIMNMCKAKDIQVLFLSVPMYYQHISNYEILKKTLNKELKKYPEAKWLDLQMPYDTTIYTPDKFENTYSANQHLSNLGMMVTAYKLAGFISENYPNLLPDRSKDPVWIEDFKSTEHFVYNQYVTGGMKGYASILKDKKIGGFHIRELVLQENKESNRLLLKIARQKNLPSVLNVQFNVNMLGNQFNSALQMNSIKEIMHPQHQIYMVDLKKEVKINTIVGIMD